MARIDDIERRLGNWARWRVGLSGGGMGYASIRRMEASAADGYRESAIPIMAGEAEETDRAVLTLPNELRRTVECYYLAPGGMRDKARHLACTEETIRQRVERAHRAISRWLADRDTARRQQRERDEAAQRDARP